MTIFSYPKAFMSWSLWLSPQASGIGNHIYVMMVMIRSNETNLIWNKFFSNLSLTMSHGGLKENACKMIDDISTKTKEIHWVDFIKSIHSQVYKMGYELTKTMHWNLSLLYMPTIALGILDSWGCVGFICPVKALFGKGSQRVVWIM